MKKRRKLYQRLVGTTAALTVASVPLVASHVEAATISFKDLQPGAQGYDEVVSLVGQGIIKGYGDQTFKPYEEISREHVAVMLSKALSLSAPVNLEAALADFNDVDSNYQYAKEIAAVAEAGIFSGNNGRFLPNQPITREQMATVLVNAFGLEGNDAQVELIDLDRIGESHRANVAVLAQHKVTLGKTNANGEHYFDGADTLKRVQFAIFLDKVMKLSGISVEAPVVEGDTEKNEKEKVTFSEKGTLDVNITELTNHGLKYKDKEVTSFYDRITDITHTYEIATKPTSFVKVTKRILDNGDHYVFTTLENNSKKPIDLAVSIPIDDTSFYTFQSFSQDKSGPRQNDDINIDLSTNPYGLLSTIKGNDVTTNVMIGKQYHSRELVEEYKGGHKAVLREFIDEIEAFDIDAKRDSISLKMDLKSDGEDIVDHWLLFSDETLFASDNGYKNYIRAYNGKKYKHNSWYTAEGPYKKVVRSAIPKSKDELGYARNLLIVREDEALIRYKQTKERFYYDVLLNSLANLEIFRKDNTFYETEYTSHWLYTAYGIHAPYVDTRHSEGVALFLEETGEVLGIPEIQNALVTYADFLVNQIKAGHVIEVGNNAGLISDYSTFHQEAVITHSSLNHVLGGLNLLLQTYMKTGDKKYLDAATYTQNGLDEIGTDWLTNEGDTWYQINPDHTFSGEDYTVLTMTDLLDSIELWEEVDASKAETLKVLAKSKAAYLKKKEVSMTNELRERLKKHGF